MFMHPITMLSMTRESVRFEGLLHENCCPLSERRSPAALLPEKCDIRPERDGDLRRPQAHGTHVLPLILTNDLYSLGI